MTLSLCLPQGSAAAAPLAGRGAGERGKCVQVRAATGLGEVNVSAQTCGGLGILRPEKRRISAPL